MKRFFAITAGLAALGVVLYGANLLLAQAPGLPAGGAVASTGAVRIAVVNMDIVRKGYKKIEFYKQEIQNMAKPFEEKLEQYKKYYEGWTKLSKEGKDAAERDNASKQALVVKRHLEDLTNEANKKIMEVSQRQVLQVYREIEDVIESYAKANGIHMVMHYADPIDPSEKYSAPNIHRKLNGCSNVGACGPIYIAPNIDISQEIVNVLNERYPATAAAGSLAPRGN